MRRKTAAMILIAAALASGCANTGLRQLVKPGEGPDEFRITPGQPLQEPQDYATLPPPAPGGSNRTDQFPLRESVEALGGRRPAEGTAIPAADGAVVNYAARFGVDPTIRRTLAEIDEDFRRRRGRLTQIRIVPVDRYNQVYRREALDPQRELGRWRSAGARTPSAPPE
jgi:hypothetical protein